jgi:hypothetical protein
MTLMLFPATFILKIMHNFFWLCYNSCEKSLKHQREIKILSFNKILILT